MPRRARRPWPKPLVVAALPWSRHSGCFRISPFEVTRGSASVANPPGLFPTVRCRRTCSGCRAILHSGDGILGLCLCVAAFHHWRHQDSQGTAAGPWPRQDHAVWPTVSCRFPWPFLVPSILPPRRILRPSFRAGFPLLRFGMSLVGSTSGARQTSCSRCTRPSEQSLSREPWAPRYIPTAIVPPLLVTHALIFLMLVRRKSARRN